MDYLAVLPSQVPSVTDPPSRPTAKPAVQTSDITGVVGAVSDQFSKQNITSFIAYIISASVVFVFLWWAVRKAWCAILSATTRGKGKI